MTKHSMVELSHIAGEVATSSPPQPRVYPQPVTLEACAAGIDTAPTGADMIFTVSLMPAATVITTGTIAATEQTATFTSFDAVAVPAGSWLEVAVTQVGSSVAGSDLVVQGKVTHDW